MAREVENKDVAKYNNYLKRLYIHMIRE